MTQEEMHETIEGEGERLLDEREAELKRRLDGFENGTSKILTPYEACSLVALLHTKDCEILERALITVSNSAAFSTNQDYLRDAGCLLRLQHLIVHSHRSVRLAAIAAVGNLALNAANQKEMQQMVPQLLPNVECMDVSCLIVIASPDVSCVTSSLERIFFSSCLRSVLEIL